MIQIKSRLSGVIRESTAASLKEAVVGAVAAGADLRWADLHGANLHGADLHGADLDGANLHGANLHGADLHGANLRGANLHGADLHGANLRGANLHGANLHGADLRWADLDGANLHGADLDWADLRWANLHGANLDAIAAARLSIVPESGAFEGWKKCRSDVLVRLEIPADSRRSSATGRKCRAEFVRVLEVIGAAEGASLYDAGTVYRPGEIVRCHEWCEDRWQECAGGIHFHLTKVEAEAYI